jgi:hypothetical protein
MIENGVAAKPIFMMAFGRNPYLIMANGQITRQRELYLSYKKNMYLKTVDEIKDTNRNSKPGTREEGTFILCLCGILRSHNDVCTAFHCFITPGDNQDQAT